LELDVHPGEFRRLTPAEVARLESLATHNKKQVSR
jgi:hypothetical protein